MTKAGCVVFNRSLHGWGHGGGCEVASAWVGSVCAAHVAGSLGLPSCEWTAPSLLSSRAARRGHHGHGAACAGIYVPKMRSSHSLGQVPPFPYSSTTPHQPTTFNQIKLVTPTQQDLHQCWLTSPSSHHPTRHPMLSKFRPRAAQMGAAAAEAAAACTRQQQLLDGAGRHGSFPVGGGA